MTSYWAKLYEISSREGRLWIFIIFYNFALAVWKIQYVFSKLQRPVELILAEPAILVQVEGAHHPPDLSVVEVDSCNKGKWLLILIHSFHSLIHLFLILSHRISPTEEASN